MSSLYELTGEYKALLEMAQDEDIDDQAFLDTMEGLQCELSLKAEGYVKVIRQLEADVEAYKNEVVRLSEKADLTKRHIKQMKDALGMAMLVTEQTEIKAGLFKLKMVGNGGLRPLKITGVVPDKFKKCVVVDDNDAIRKHIEELEKAGLECSWAQLEERGKHLSIK